MLMNIYNVIMMLEVILIILKIIECKIDELENMISSLV